MRSTVTRAGLANLYISLSGKVKWEKQRTVSPFSKGHTWESWIMKFFEIPHWNYEFTCVCLANTTLVMYNHFKRSHEPTRTKTWSARFHFQKLYACFLLFYMKFYRSPILSNCFYKRRTRRRCYLAHIISNFYSCSNVQVPIFSVYFVSVFAALLKVVFLWFALFQYKITI